MKEVKHERIKKTSSSKLDLEESKNAPRNENTGKTQAQSTNRGWKSRLSSVSRLPCSFMYILYRCIHIHMYIYIYIYIYTYIVVHHIYICVCVYIYMYVCLYVCIYICLHMYIYILTCVYIFALKGCSVIFFDHATSKKSGCGA